MFNRITQVGIGIMLLGVLVGFCGLMAAIISKGNPTVLIYIMWFLFMLGVVTGFMGILVDWNKQ